MDWAGVDAMVLWGLYLVGLWIVFWCSDPASWGESLPLLLYPILLPILFLWVFITNPGPTEDYYSPEVDKPWEWR